MTWRPSPVARPSSRLRRDVNSAKSAMMSGAPTSPSTNPHFYRAAWSVHAPPAESAREVPFPSNPVHAAQRTPIVTLDSRRCGWFGPPVSNRLYGTEDAAECQSDGGGGEPNG